MARSLREEEGGQGTATVSVNRTHNVHIYTDNLLYIPPPKQTHLPSQSYIALVELIVVIPTVSVSRHAVIDSAL